MPKDFKKGDWGGLCIFMGRAARYVAEAERWTTSQATQW